MSRHALPTEALTDDENFVEVGYDSTHAEFWYSVHTPEGEDLCAMEIRTLKDLVLETWGFVEWRDAGPTLKALHDDAGWSAHTPVDDREAEIIALLRAALESPNGDCGALPLRRAGQ